MANSRQINVYIDGVVKATADDEIAARYHGQHYFSEALREGRAAPVVEYKVRTVTRNKVGDDVVTEVPVGATATAGGAD